MKIKQSKHPNGFGTSFSFITFRASTNDIIEKFGNPSFNEPENYEEKVTREWELELEDGTMFTIYDWKEYHYFCDEEKIEWHVGTDWGAEGRRKHDAKVLASLEEAGFETTWNI